MKLLIVNILVALILIILFDVISYNAIPAHYTNRFWEYRKDAPPEVGGQGKYPKGYFIADEQRGFDIGRNTSGQHWVSGITYPIWSNSLGCFDNEHDKNHEYVYFAGDSFTWGYADFGQKFGTLVEKMADTRVYKCGVTNTGQQHQLEKLVQIVKEQGNTPKAIFIFYFENDALNDYAHPHTTVVRGWLTDSVSVDNNNKLVRPTREELKERVDQALENIQENKNRREKQPKIWLNAKRTLKYYSLSANIFDKAKDTIYEKKQQMIPDKQITPRRTLRGYTSLPREKDGRYWYRDNPIAQNNKNALLEFESFSKRNNAELAVVLIPPRRKYRDTGWYEELREFLVKNEIRYIDLASKFDDAEYKLTDVYWDDDAHFNPSGNKIVAEIVIKEFPEIFQ